MAGGTWGQSEASALQAMPRGRIASNSGNARDGARESIRPGLDPGMTSARGENAGIQQPGRATNHWRTH